MRKLILASAGAGKSSDIAAQALKRASEGEKVLILTYTINNQKELAKKICEQNTFIPRNIVIKGWFTFLLEDMIRPYQQCLFPKRIVRVNFNKNGDPHKKDGRMIAGRKEVNNGRYNPAHYLTPDLAKAHTAYLSKLAVRINKQSGSKPIKRLSKIYNAIFIDEVQDLIGWDFDLVTAISKIKECAVIGVGDFRQTVYSTHVTTKQPKKSDQKITRFNKAGFTPEYLHISWRCAQPVCDFADLVHSGEGFPKTISKIDNIPPEFNDHHGVFVVPTSKAAAYIARYKPVILRTSRITEPGLCDGHKALNFGISKGLGFDRILIIPTQKHRDFIAGKQGVFAADKTEEAKNTLYVAITRARYSVAFLYDDQQILSSITPWTG